MRSDDYGQVGWSKVSKVFDNGQVGDGSRGGGRMVDRNRLMVAQVADRGGTLWCSNNVD